MLNLDSEYLSEDAAPYTYNAILAYAADKGWGVRGMRLMSQDSPEGPPTRQQVLSGIDLLQFNPSLTEVRFRLPDPPPDWLVLPPGFLTGLTGST